MTILVAPDVRTIRKLKREARALEARESWAALGVKTHTAAREVLVGKFGPGASEFTFGRLSDWNSTTTLLIRHETHTMAILTKDGRRTGVVAVFHVEPTNIFAPSAPIKYSMTFSMGFSGFIPLRVPITQAFVARILNRKLQS